MSTCHRFNSKTALVTAATEGIGFAIAQRLAQEGASVIICSRKQAKVDAALAALRAQGHHRVAGMACHVGDNAQLQALVRFAVDTFGELDVVVSNAAVNPAVGPILELEPSVVDKLFGINVVSAINLLRLAVPHMRPGGAIVLVSSYAAYSPSQPIALYGVTKTTLVGLTKALAEELGPPPQRIRVNGIAPGVVPTKFAAALVETTEAEQLHVNSTALKRLGTPEDMAATVAFLASSDAAYITGETIVAAGGVHSRL